MSSTGSFFATLPLDLILLIENHLSNRDLSRLCRTSRTLKQIFTHTLDKRVTADFKVITSQAVSDRRILSLQSILALPLNPAHATNLDLDLWVRDRLKREVQDSLGSRRLGARDRVGRLFGLHRRQRVGPLLRTTTSYSPLRHYEVGLGQAHIVTEMNFLKLLLAHGISPVEPISPGPGYRVWTMGEAIGAEMMHQAVLNGDVELVRWLFDAARLTVRPSDLKIAKDVSLLDIALYRRLKGRMKNVEEMIQLLVDNDPDPKQTCCVRFRGGPPVIWRLDLKNKKQPAADFSKQTRRCGPLGIQPANRLVE